MYASAELFKLQGFSGTGMKQIVDSAQAPFGSVYHFFPGGKDQLGDEVIRWSGRMYLELFYAIFDAAADPAAAVRDFFLGAAEVLRQTDWADACPIATIALEVANTNEPLRQATADVFQSWIDGATERYVGVGVDPGQARELVTNFICMLEGAFILCRAMRTTAPLESAGEAAYQAAVAVVPKRSRSGSRSRRRA
jgi:AcrR family transcriptional regulator